MKDSLYHRLLRVSSLTLALVLLFESGLLSPFTKELSEQTHEYLSAAIGVGAGVAPTELNQMTAELTIKRKELAEREAAIQKREIAVSLNTGDTSSGSSDRAVYILSVILFILLVLITINYALDFMRRGAVNKRVYEKTT